MDRKQRMQAKNLETEIILVTVFTYSRALTGGSSLQLFLSLKTDHLDLYVSSLDGFGDLCIYSRWFQAWGPSALSKQSKVPPSKSHQGRFSLHCFVSCLGLGFVWFWSFLFRFSQPRSCQPTPWVGQPWESLSLSEKDPGILQGETQ